jgi:dehydrogenase/reductase SDR family member 7B
MKRFENKVVWITGASSGIGKALAIAFANEGARIILSGRRVDALQAVAHELPTDAMVHPFEVTDFATLDSRVNEAWSWAGRVDILVNNAGISQRSLAMDTDPDVYTHLMNVDLMSPIWLTQLQLRRMADAGGGHIIAVSSIAGRIGAPLRTAYSAAKHGLIGYMDALRSEVAELHNIQVTNILPGSVATDIARNSVTSDGSKRGRSDANIDTGDDPIDCANAILDAVENKVPELIYAKGMERDLAAMRHQEPEKFFALAAQLGKQLATDGAPE